MMFGPAIQFGTQFLSERHVGGRQAVPPLLGELNELSLLGGEAHPYLSSSPAMINCWISVVPS